MSGSASCSATRCPSLQNPPHATKTNSLATSTWGADSIISRRESHGRFGMLRRSSNPAPHLHSLTTTINSTHTFQWRWQSSMRVWSLQRLCRAPPKWAPRFISMAPDLPSWILYLFAVPPDLFQDAGWLLTRLVSPRLLSGTLMNWPQVASMRHRAIFAASVTGTLRTLPSGI